MRDDRTPTGRAWRFWRWLHALAESRIREIYLKERHFDRCCPHCGRSIALYGMRDAREVHADEDRHAWTCVACGRESIWRFIGMGLAEPIAANGQPLPSVPVMKMETLNG